MLELQSEVNELRVAIDRIMHQMHINIRKKDYSNLAAMLSVRREMLQRLMMFSDQDVDKETLRNYLIELRERDQAIIELIGEGRAEVEAQLINLNKITSYVNPVMRGVV